MANKNLAALILRLIGAYWLVQGTFALSVAIIAGVFHEDKIDGQSSIAILTLVITAAAIYPIAAVVLLRFADRIAELFCTAPDSPAPVHFTITTGLSLLGVYFFVWGLHDTTEVLTHIRIAVQEASVSALTSLFFDSLIRAVVFLISGAVLVAQPKWLRSCFANLSTTGKSAVSESRD